MPSGASLLDRARQHLGEPYVNVLVPKNNPNWHGPWDCAEFAAWLVYQEAGILYGCLDDTANPAHADAYTGAWKTDAERRGIMVSVERAASIVGGIVLRYPPASGEMGHIAICDGAGGTVEAKGKAFGVVQDTVHGRRWDTGVLVPGIAYDTNVVAQPVTPPTHVYYLGAPNMDPAIVEDIQRALRDRGFDPGPIDGVYGGQTAAAVGAFQATEGLVVDGEVGRHTAEVLGVSLVPSS